MTRFTNNFFSHREQNFPFLNDVLEGETNEHMLDGVLPELNLIPRRDIMNMVYKHYQYNRIIYTERNTQKWVSEYYSRLISWFLDTAPLLNTMAYNPQDYMFDGWTRQVDRELTENDTRDLTAQTDTRQKNEKDSTENVKQHDTEKIISDSTGTSESGSVDIARGFDIPQNPQPLRGQNVNSSDIKNVNALDPVAAGGYHYIGGVTSNDGRTYVGNKQHSETDDVKDMTRDTDYTHLIDDTKNQQLTEVEAKLMRDDESTHTVHTQYDVQDRLKTSIESYKDLTPYRELIDRMAVMFLTTSIDVNYV